MSERIYITEDEHVRLMKQGLMIATSFGGNRVWLARDETGKLVSAWTLPLLAEWRGYTVSQGAGI